MLTNRLTGLGFSIGIGRGPGTALRKRAFDDSITIYVPVNTVFKHVVSPVEKLGAVSVSDRILRAHQLR